MRNKKWIFIPFAIAAVVFLLGSLVMALWNAVLPEITGLKRISFWQAIGLLLLCRILFGGWGGQRGGGPFGRRMHDRKPPSWEERQRLKELWRERCRMRRTENGPE